MDFSLNAFSRLFRKYHPDPNFIAADLPKIFWIELTSTCPFDCVFCSRKTIRGKGQHMPFSLYRDLITQMRKPEILRLNYAGESIHYPRLIDSIRLAAATGAHTELVSTFATAPSAMLGQLVDSGLDSLTISLHTFDANQYRSIYRHGSLEKLKRNVDELLRLQQIRGAKTPALSFAFVAMRRNLSQLPAVAEYAASIGASDLFIQPVHIQDVLSERFEEERDDHPGNAAFKEDIRRAAHEHAARYPSMNVAEVCMEEPGPWAVDHVPRNFPPRLPAGCRIHSCEQNPWDTAHILSNGDVVACEVIDRLPLGNLNREALADIWHGRPYRAFRRDYVTGNSRKCRECPFKFVYRPRPPVAGIDARDGLSRQLLRGWYGNDDGGIIWSKETAMAFLKRPMGAHLLRLRGILPSMPGEPARTLEIHCNDVFLGTVTNGSGEFLSFDRSFALKSPGAVLNLRFSVTPSFRPSDDGQNRDFRVLGFALSSMEVS
jgi:radical SAM protein with 4Fe4S-binding SPASM domain